MSDWMIEISDDSLMGQERRISSAYKMMVEEEEKGNWKMSLTYKMKRWGPRIEPCGTPEIMGILKEVAPSTTTCCEQEVR